jgi:hypothetical protein
MRRLHLLWYFIDFTTSGQKKVSTLTDQTIKHNGHWEKLWTGKDMEKHSSDFT